MVRWRRRDRTADTGATAGRGRGGTARPADAERPSRIDRALFPVFGPADVGPYDTPEREYVAVDEDCSVCFRPVSQHTTDRSGGRSRLVCPAPGTGGPAALTSGR